MPRMKCVVTGLDLHLEEAQFEALGEFFKDEDMYAAPPMPLNLQVRSSVESAMLEAPI